MVGPPGSPTPTSPASPPHPQRPMSAMMRPARSSSRLSMGSRAAGTTVSDEDGRTSVKVAVRVRPPLKSTDPGYDLIPQRFQKGMVHITSPTSIAIDSPQGRKIFVFDRVFGPDVDQDGVWEYLEESVAAFLQGYNVSLLAYGQSGAGKSYTMGTSGPGEQGDHKVMGVIPRAAEALFERLGGGGPSSSNRNSGIRAPVRYSTSISTLQRHNPDKGWTMKATYVEIYNEQLRDLLLPEGTRPEERAPITIREDTKGRILLTGLRQVEINTVEDLLGALNFGSSIRQTDATAINAKSSRSHAVFSLNLVQRKNRGAEGTASKRMSMPVDLNQDGFMTVDSKMHFVDLAGSERLKNTHAQGERAREGISINAGLASLGKVISQLSVRQAGSHVSYRDSKLTRLLQDSLGGNAITYMIACVTPAEFHLSETLNTVQYAQRARAIQSKPRIQQITDDGDMKQLVDRLRAEIAFLREQLKNNNEISDRAPKNASASRSDRSSSREIELQNQLLDLQENYSALSQRHAKLISEITRARDTEEPPTPTTEYTDTAVERLKRSNSFAEAVEQLVLEYEETIRSLETSLTSTRSSLSNSESTLLEKESRLAYTETMNHQLQARLQKMMDREMSTESYLHDLEAKLHGHASGEEKNNTIITELKKEIARVRENEAGCEDYISTLEERLAESEQDMELMQREIARLEHVVERQRSLGKLDGLLLELDSVKKEQENGTKDDVHDDVDIRGEDMNGDAQERPMSKSSLRSENSARSNKSARFDDEPAQDIQEPIRRIPTPPVKTTTPPILESLPEEEYPLSSRNGYVPHSPAQSQFVADKLENVQQELFDLKVEHESTLTEYDQLSASYEAALSQLAALQDQLDEAKHSHKSGTLLVEGTSRGTSPPQSPIQRPSSFLADARVSDLKGFEGQPSSSRSLSSELSLAGESPASTDITETDNGDIESARLAEVQRAARNKEEALLREVEELRREKEEAMRIFEEEQQDLHTQLKNSLDELSQLRSRDRRKNGGSPPTNQLLRRKSNQSLATVDRAQRAFTALRRIASEQFEHDPEVLDNFELNLDGAMRELTARTERIAELENEVARIRGEMESKAAIINGLTRERTSIQTSPMDISVVAVMERRIEESEGQLAMTRKLLADREQELASAKQALETRSDESASDAVALLEELTKERTLNAEQAKMIEELHLEIEDIKRGHDAALSSLQNSKDALERTIHELEDTLAYTKGQSQQHEHQVRLEVAQEIAHYQERIEALQLNISENKSALASQLMRVAELEKLQADAEQYIAEQAESNSEASESELKKQRMVVEDLEKTIAQNKEVMEAQQARLDTLEQMYEEANEELKDLRLKEEESSARAEEEAAANAKAQETLLLLEGQLQESMSSLTILQASHDDATATITKLRKETGEENSKLVEDRATLASQIDVQKETIQQQFQEIIELREALEKKLKDYTKVMDKEKKHGKLLEDLEQQLTSMFDQNQETARKFAALQKEYDTVKAERDALVATGQSKNEDNSKVIETLNQEIATLKTKLAEAEMELQGLGGGRAQRSNSTSSNSNLRKSTSTVSLPSPPPAIPLPPLPGSASGTAAPAPAAPPMSRRPSKDYVAVHMDDQEARIKTLEKQLQAEKALTATLEEALTDCEKTMKRLTSDRDSFQAKASQVQQELERQRNESQTSRYSMQAVEEERMARQKAEQAREQLELRMQALAKKNKRSFACF